MSQAIIKPASSKEFQGLLELVKEYFHSDSIPWNSHIEKGLKQVLRLKRLGQVWLIQVEKKNVGYLILTFGFDLEFGGIEGIITDLYVQSEFRSQGLGALALDTCRNYCRAKGIKAIELQVENKNKGAQRFYKKRGFTAHDRTPFSIWIGD